jgi:hypothetical protein
MLELFDGLTHKDQRCRHRALTWSDHLRYRGPGKPQPSNQNQVDHFEFGSMIVKLRRATTRTRCAAFGQFLLIERVVKIRQHPKSNKITRLSTTESLLPYASHPGKGGRLRFQSR